MKVVLLTNILNPFRIFFYDKLFEEYKAQNVEFSVLVMVPNEPGRTWQYEDFKRNYTTLLKGGLRKISGIDFIFNPEIGKIIKKIQPDIVVCAGSYMLTSVWTVLRLKKKLKYKVFYWSESHLHEKRDYNKIKLAIREFFRNTVISKFDGFWFAGKLSKEFIDKYAAQNSYYVFVPNLVQEEVYYSATKVTEKQKKAKREELGVTDKVVFMSPVRLSKEKGVLEFLDIMKQVKSKENSVIIMPGQGELKEKIAEKAQDCGVNLKLVGFQNQENMVMLYAMADAFLLPSLSDPNPLSCIEASWSGKPLLVSEHVGNYPEIIDQGINGYVFSYSRPQEAADYIDCIISRGTEWRTSAGKRSLEIAQEKYNSEKVVHRIATETLGIMRRSHEKI